MGFTSNVFLFIVLPISILVYLLVNRFCSSKVKNITIILLSYIFYLWSSIDTFFLFLLLSFIVYLFGQLIYLNNLKSERGSDSRKYLTFFLILAVGYLFLSKYAVFVLSQIKLLKYFEFTLESILVPIGVSFVIFEAVSYVVDIYRGAEPGSLLDVMLFLSMFSKIVSGPIVLWKDFVPQVKYRYTDSILVTQGINRIIIGYAKKAIIADTFGAQIQLINNVASASGVDTFTLWIKAILYFFQIYYDFSGYSDIAIGLSNIFGFKFKDNFNFPYISCSVSEFWRRWHISLGTWFREYVYIPLGGNRKGNVYFHLLVVFLLTGIWHGANWTFVVWGILNGVFVVIERFIRDKQWYRSIPLFVKWFFTICIIFFEWIIFSSSSMADAVLMICQMFTFTGINTLNFTWKYFLSKKIVILLSIAAIGSVFDALPIKEKIEGLSSTSWGSVIRYILYIMLFVISILFVVNSSYSPFLYFQF